MLWFMGSQRVRTQLSNWTEMNLISYFCIWQLSWKLLTSVPLTFSLVYVCSAMADSLRPHRLYSLPGSSLHGSFLSRILEWVAIPTPRNLSNPGIKFASLMSPALADNSSPLCHLGSPAGFPPSVQMWPPQLLSLTTLCKITAHSLHIRTQSTSQPALFPFSLLDLSHLNILCILLIDYGIINLMVPPSSHWNVNYTGQGLVVLVKYGT